MNANVVLSTLFPLLVLLPLVFTEDSGRVKRKADPPWARNSWPNNYRGPPGHAHDNKFNGQTDFNRNRGPPGGRGPPGLTGGGPPGLNEHKSTGWSGHEKPSYDDKDRRVDEKFDQDGGPVGPDNKPARCRTNDFHCGSGECLPASVRCNGISECFDSSDEADCIPPEEGGCILPAQPEGGSYELGGCGKPCSKQPGDKVPKHSILNYTCQANYVLSGNTISVCINDEWYMPTTCIKTCPGLISTSLEISCTFQGNSVSCTERIVPGTRAVLACKHLYKLPVTNDPAYRELTCLNDGSWDRRLFRCLPECGTSIAQGNTLIVRGFQAKIGTFPWHVAIYRKDEYNEYEQICGGSLISSNLVVSAAHCFYDEVHQKLPDESQYAVAAGKYYRNWDSDENYAQKSPVSKILLAGRYLGVSGNFAEDIALIKLSEPFELTALVRPVCLDWDNVYEREQLQIGQSGKAVGWGKTITGLPSDSLQEINMPFVPYDQCLAAVPTDFRGYITSDKFCAGHLNGSSLCDGDSGGGLCFEKYGIWYLRGVVSVSPIKGDSCDYNSYVGFTNVSQFRDWIRSIYVDT